ncbi:serine hydrolase [Tepidanaerobacter sp. EBM-49]|uniref:serine hydrolase n=1 Tax=Tepidanaerobacter sp. EBM-49 TaxID=1918504 RepID=UPI00257D4E02|nr:serine hydrolase [Tepidanaerobacter sp. EBM-49]
MLIETVQDLIKDVDGVCSVVIDSTWSDEKIFINEDKIMSSASIIKLWILWKLYAESERQDIDLKKEIIPLKDENKAPGAGVLQYMNSGLNLSLHDYATLMITLSDNTATNILIDYLGMESINQEIKKLRMPNTCLQRKMMDMKARSCGKDNLTSAKDVYDFFVKLLKGHDISAQSRNEMINMLLCQQFNDRLSLYLPEDIQFAHKTGGLFGIEHDAGIFFINDTKVIIVVMMSNLKNNADGLKVHNALGAAVYNYFLNQ